MVRRKLLRGIVAFCMQAAWWAVGAHAQALGPAAASAADVVLPAVSLVPDAVILNDPSGKLDFAQALRAARAGAGRHVDNQVFSTGFSTAANWFVIELENRQSAALQRLLVVEPAWLDDVQVTLVGTQGVLQSFVGGDTLAFAHRSRPYHLINLDLDVPPGRSTLVVRVQTRDPFSVNLRLLSQEAFGQFAAQEGLYYGLVYGGLLSLLLFNFVLALSSREKAYFAYCGLLVTFLLMHACYNGHLFRWVLGDLPVVSNWAHSVLIYLYSFSGLCFALVFLDLENKLPAAYAWTRRLLALMTLSFALSALFGGYRGQVISSIAWVCVFVVAALTLAILSLQRRNAAALLYLNGSIAGLVGASLTALSAMGVISYSFWTFKAVDIGMLLDASMLSLALSARISQARRLERLRRFFSPAVADQLLSAPNAELYRPHRREIVVLFLDLRGYTAFTLQHDADEVMRVLGEFHAAMGEVIHAHGATLERFAGDGMMIFLNDPVEIPDPALRGAAMAQEMQARFQHLGASWQRRGYNLSMGIGMAQGVATIGAIGFEGRRDYAAIGNVTNLAARLCAEARGGQILVSRELAEHVRGTVALQAASALALKGFQDPVECFELAPHEPSAPRPAIDASVATGGRLAPS